jgi:hypothetical protein
VWLVGKAASLDVTVNGERWFEKQQQDGRGTDRLVGWKVGY